MITVELIETKTNKRVPNNWHRMTIKYISNNLIIAKDYPDGQEIPFLRNGKEWNWENTDYYFQITDKSMKKINKKSLI